MEVLQGADFPPPPSLWQFGHNEVDEPRVTNVELYQVVDQQARLSDELQRRYALDSSQMEQVQSVNDEFSAAAAQPRQSGHVGESDLDQLPDARHARWAARAVSVDSPSETSLVTCLRHLTDIPQGFSLSRAVKRVVEKRKEVLREVQSGNLSVPVDWSTAESLALAALATGGVTVRLSGQDSQRGTFTQRHAVWHDQASGARHTPLPPGVEVCDSPLSELGVVGFEHGWTLVNPNSLGLWEAQFGDFFNNAEVIIDNVVSAEQEKWALESNLVFLLPHGYDGMGPEHSSSRVERWLQMTTDNPDDARRHSDPLGRLEAANFSVLHPSSPSSYFHALFRQVSTPFRRPAFVLAPKRLLRLPAATSPFSELPNGRFAEVLDDPRIQVPSTVRSLLFTAGEVYYDVLQVVGNNQQVAVVRLEQLSPFPLSELATVVNRYPDASRALWVQEEPANAGARAYVAPFFEKCPEFSSLEFDVVSRPWTAAPAIGVDELHRASQATLLEEVKRWCSGEL
jgi:2-oxoglutarate dehydrogenase complex dehydrogenase (E1) component-like enzyme